MKFVRELGIRMRVPVPEYEGYRNNALQQH